MDSGSPPVISSNDLNTKNHQKRNQMKINLTQSSFIQLLCATLLAVAVAGHAAENNAGAEKAATSAAQTWLATIDGGDYAQSGQAASALFRSAITKDK